MAPPQDHEFGPPLVLGVCTRAWAAATPAASKPAGDADPGGAPGVCRGSGLGVCGLVMGGTMPTGFRR